MTTSKDIVIKNFYKGIVNINELKNNIQKNKPDFFFLLKKSQNIILQIATDNLQIKIDNFKKKIEEIEELVFQLSKEKPKNYLDTLEGLNQRLCIGKQRKNALQELRLTEYKVLSEFLSKEDIITKDNFDFIQKNISNIEKLVLPIQDIEDKEIQDMTLAVILNLSKLTKYANQDFKMAQEKAQLLKSNLSEYSFYAIKRGLELYIKYNEDYPWSLKTLRDYIEPYNNEGLILYVNIQFLMS